MKKEKIKQFCIFLLVLTTFLTVNYPHNVHAGLFDWLTGKKGKNEETVKIGVIASLTGSGAPYGQNSWNGIQLAARDINDARGINGNKIELVVQDDKTTAGDAVTILNKFIGERLPLIIGPWSSSSVMACAPLANKNHVVLLSPGAASPNITLAGDYIFRNRASGTLEAIKTAEFAYNILQLRKMDIIRINTDYGLGFSNVFEEYFTKLGGRIGIIEQFDQGKTDFRSHISKLQNNKSDGVYLVGVPIEAGTILKQAYEMGFHTIFVTNNMENPELIKIAGQAAEGIYFAIPAFDTNDPNPKLQEFVKKYKDKYQKLPDMFAADGYDAVFISKIVIEKGGYDGDRIKEALYQIQNYQGVYGNINFDNNGDVVKILTIKTVKDGKFVIYE